MPESVLDAIKMGHWNFEPEEVDRSQYNPTRALPGSEDKLAILAQRVARGLPLWHPADRISYDEECEPQF